MRFHDRTDAGRRLARLLAKRAFDAPAIIALPRGGVPVAYEIARALHAPLDVLIARKLGAPGQEELAIGAIAEAGGFYLNVELTAQLGVSDAYIDDVLSSELVEIERRRDAYRYGKPLLDLEGRTAIVVDDGLATGATMMAAIDSLRAQKPRGIVVAVPVCAPDTAAAIEREVTAVVCALRPPEFGAVGLWFDEFDQTSDETVIELLQRADAELEARAVSSSGGVAWQR